MIMVLYAKEVVTPDRIMAAVQRFQLGHSVNFPPPPQDYEEGLLLWISSACSALKRRIEQEKQDGGGEASLLYNLVIVDLLHCGSV